jgi:type I restriction enzyme S subunit
MIVGWQRGPLGKFAELVSTGPFGSMLHQSDYVSDGVPLINPTNIVDESIVPDLEKQVSDEARSRLASYVLKAGDVVVARRGEIGRCAVVGIAEAGWVCSTGCFFIRPRSTADARFLARLLRSPVYRDHLERASTGATMKNISNTALANLPVALPPIDEQRRIVAILDEAFEAIAIAKANTEKNLQNAREWAAGQLSAALVVASASGRSGALETLVAPSCTLSYGIVQPGEDVPDGLPVVRPIDLGERTVFAKRLKRIDPTLARSYTRTTLEGGDLLLCVRGTTGTVAMAEPALAGANVTRGIVPVRFDPRVITQELGYYLLRSEPVQAQIRAKTYGAALMQINIGDLRKIVVAFPSIEKQAALVKQLDAIQESADRLAELYGRKLVALDELKKSLLHQAVTGKLTAKSNDKQLEAVA